ALAQPLISVACARLANRAVSPYNSVQHKVCSGDTTMADGSTPIKPETPSEAVTPRGVNHLVINVRDMEESHKFWTEILGFKQVGQSSRRPMRFYSGNHDGLMNHHD